MKRSEVETSLPLVYQVFQEYEKCEHPEVFYEAIHDDLYLDSLCMYGAYEKKELVGVIATRNKGSHIALFFVKGEYQGQGIGRMLMEKVWEENTYPVMSVHSSLYAQPIYEKLGFIVTGPLTEEDGFHYIPMEYRMDIMDGLVHLPDKKAYALSIQIGAESSESNRYSSYLESFLSLMDHSSSYVRTRGFVLACAQAKWDVENKLEKNLDRMLELLKDEKPTVVRQCIKALYEVILYKPELFEPIAKSMRKIDLSVYKDSMAPLIEKDIQNFLKRG